MIKRAYIPPAFKKQLRDRAVWAAQNHYSFDEVWLELARMDIDLDLEGIQELHDLYDATRYPQFRQKAAEVKSGGLTIASRFRVFGAVGMMHYTVENQEIAIFEEAQDEHAAFEIASNLARRYRGKRFRVFFTTKPYADVWFEHGNIVVKDIHAPTVATVQQDPEDLFLQYRDVAVGLEQELQRNDEPTGRSERLEQELDQLGKELGFCDLDSVADDLFKTAAQINTRVAGRRDDDSRRRYKGVCVRPEKRLALYLRDSFQCVYCGRDLRSEPVDVLTLDHLQPRSRGGGQDPKNLVTACRSCNSARKDKPVTQMTSPQRSRQIRQQAKRSYRRYHGIAKALLAQQFSLQDIEQRVKMLKHI